MVCARQYLEMDKPHALRHMRLKCLTCDVTINPQWLSNKCYRKDYLLMSLDNKNDYKCVYNEMGCNFKGSQMELDRHLKNTCYYRIIKCEGSNGDGRCGLSYRICDKQKHQSECYFYIYCKRCNEYIERDIYNYHMYRPN